MPASKSAAHPDRFGLLMAHVQLMREGQCCDNLDDERLFTEQILRIIGKVEMVATGNFGHDYEFVCQGLLIQTAIAASKNRDPLIAIEGWLEEVLAKAGRLYLN